MVSNSESRKYLMRQYGVHEHNIQRLEESVASGDWDSIFAIAFLDSRNSGIFFQLYFDLFPDDRKYEYLLYTYTHGGDNMSFVRKEIRRARHYGNPEFPPELDGQEVLTVYRAGAEPIDRAKLSLSWTLDLDKAIWFKNAKELMRLGDCHIYQAKIKKDKVLAYTDIREEKEVIQYRNVFDIVDITDSIPASEQ